MDKISFILLDHPMITEGPDHVPYFSARATDTRGKDYIMFWMITNWDNYYSSYGGDFDPERPCQVFCRDSGKMIPAECVRQIIWDLIPD